MEVLINFKVIEA